jgi:hypothetical protein
VTALDLPDDRLTPEELRALGASPHLGALRALSLYNFRLTEERAQALADWPILPRLHWLDLCPESSEAFVALAGAGRLTSLRRLTYRGGVVSPASVDALAVAAPGLTHVEIGHGDEPGDPDGLAALVEQLPLTSLRMRALGHIDPLMRPPLAEGLTSLDLNRVPLTAEAVASLAGWPRLGQLRRLSLVETRLGKVGAGTLADAPFAALTSLHLQSAALDCTAVGSLAASPRLAGLRSLALCVNPIGDEGAAALASSPHLRGLDSLDLSYCHIGPRGAAALAASPNLTGLRFLDLTHNALGDEGIRALAASPYLGELHTLKLMNVQCGLEGVRALAQARGLGKLRRLIVRFNAFSLPDLLPEFTDPSRLPNLLEVVWDYRGSTSMASLGRPPQL